MQTKVNDINEKLNKPIVLIGHMAVGKTKLGRILAKVLGRPFYDADHEIEKAAGMTIPQIFEQLGEAEFREGERKVLKRLIEEHSNAVISTGGGAILNEETRERVFTKALSIWIRADIDTILKRSMKKKGSRPLLAVADPKKKLEELAQIRDPIYKRANIQLESDEGQVSVLQEIMVNRIYECLEK